MGPKDDATPTLTNPRRAPGALELATYNGFVSITPPGAHTPLTQGLCSPHLSNWLTMSYLLPGSLFPPLSHLTVSVPLSLGPCACPPHLPGSPATAPVSESLSLHIALQPPLQPYLKGDPQLLHHSLHLGLELLRWQLPASNAHLVGEDHQLGSGQVSAGALLIRPGPAL